MNRHPSRGAARRPRAATSLLVAGALILAACGGEEDAAADYPSETIELTVPHPAGGGTDTINRTIEPLLAEELGTQIDVIVRDGGAGAIAVAHLMEQPADGYTILGIEGGVATTGPAGNPDLPYEADDITPVARMTNDPWVLLASIDSGIETVDEFTELAQSGEGLRVGIAGVMSSDHYGLLLMMENIDDQELRYVTYGGGGPKQQAIYAGEVDVILDTASAIDEELVTPLAVLAEERLDHLPDLPTAVESGYDGAVSSLWQGIAVHRDTPVEVIDILADAIVNAASSDEFAERMSEMGLAAAPQARQDFEEFVANEYEQASELVAVLSDTEIIDES